MILATGSELRPTAALPGPVPAIDVDALLESGVPPVEARSAVVLDDEGGFLAPTAAERLVAEGFAVEIATTHQVVAAEVDPTQQPFVFRRLALGGVVMTPHRAGVSTGADGVTLRDIYTERDERREGVGLVVMAGYRRAVVDLRDGLRAAQPGASPRGGRRRGRTPHAARRGRRRRSRRRRRVVGQKPGRRQGFSRSACLTRAM